MATADVDVCNIALSKLGVKKITSLTADSSRAALLCAELYPSCRDSALVDGQWNFAQVRTQLARLQDAPAFGFLYQYTIPPLPYCLKVNETDPDDAVWTIEANADATVRVLLTDEPEISIRYTARVTDVLLYNAAFVEALAMLLASELAMPLVEKASAEKSLREKYEILISRALTADAQEGSQQVADNNVLLDVRDGGVFFDRSMGRFSS